MIRAFYNLNSLPFQNDISPENIFQTDSGIELKKRFEYMQSNRGIMLITGNPGTGKTLHTRTFVHRVEK